MTNELETIRVFVGTDATQVVAHQVLAYSLRKHTQREVAVYPMRDLPLPTPRDPDNRSRTGFSFYRFTIPRQCGYRGRAIYLDPDTLVFGDIAGLPDTAMGENIMMCTRQTHAPEAWKDHPGFRRGPQSSVMLLDCARLDWDIEHIVAQLDAGTFSYHQLMQELCSVPAERWSSDLPPEWNHLEEYHHGVTKLLHYTVAPTQPWRCLHNPLGSRVSAWRSCYREAVHAGAVRPTRRLPKASNAASCYRKLCRRSPLLQSDGIPGIVTSQRSKRSALSFRMYWKGRSRSQGNAIHSTSARPSTPSSSSR